MGSSLLVRSRRSWFESARTRRERHDSEWRQSKVEMAAWLADPRFRRRARRATVIWRGIGWALVAGPLVAGPLAVRGLALALPAGTWLVDSWPVQDLAAFGLAYAAMWRLGAQALHYRIKREPMHLFGYRGILGREKWWHLVPGSRGVNKLEYRLRWGKRHPKAIRYVRRAVVVLLIAATYFGAGLIAAVVAGSLVLTAKTLAKRVGRVARVFGRGKAHLYHWRYFVRTVLAALIGRFWWVALGLAGSVWWWGAGRTLRFLQVIGHRL